MRTGSTLAELLVVAATIALITAIAAPRVVALRDGAAVHAAVIAVRTALAAARGEARNRASPVVLALDARARRVVALAGAARDTVLIQPLGTELGVALEATGDTVRFAPSGLGYGVSNTTIVLRRGAAADTLRVSRLGRVR